MEAALAASQLDPTHYPPHGTPGRLDVVLLNKTAAEAFTGYSVLDDTGLPAHRPVIASLSLQRFRTLHSQLKRPKCFPSVRGADPHEDQLRAEQTFQPHAQSWASALSNRDVDSLFGCWSKFSEDFLCRRASVDLEANSGRGKKCPHFIKQPNCAVFCLSKGLGSQTIVEERCLRKLARQVEELQRQAPAALGPWPSG